MQKTELRNYRVTAVLNIRDDMNEKRKVPAKFFNGDTAAEDSKAYANTLKSLRGLAYIWLCITHETDTENYRHVTDDMWTGTRGWEKRNEEFVTAKAPAEVRDAVRDAIVDEVNFTKPREASVPSPDGTAVPVEPVMFEAPINLNEPVFSD